MRTRSSGSLEVADLQSLLWARADARTTDLDF